MATSTSSIGGLISGLDTKTLISQLIAVAAQPQTKLKTQLTSTNAQVAAAQSINTKAASMTSLAKELASSTTYTTASASSSDSSVSATASSTAGSASVSFNVTALAKAESQLSDELRPAGTANFQFQLARPSGGSTVTITAETDSAVDIAKAINAFVDTADGSDAGVTAIVVGAGSSQRLQVTADKTGANSTFTLTGLPTNPANQPMTFLEQASDAEIKINGASGNASSLVALKSSTNTFTGLMTGVDVTVSKADEFKVVTVSTAVNQSAITSKVSGLVTAMNNVLSDVAFHTKQPGTGVTASATNGGLLAGQSSFRDLSGSILDTISASVGSNAAVKAGLSVGRDGTVSFDSSTFASLYKSDPTTAQAVLTAFGAAVQTVGKNASDSSSGSVTAFITGGTSSAKTLTDRIADWDLRLDAKQTRLTAQYAALETSLQKLKSQSDSLTSALASLTSNNS